MAGTIARNGHVFRAHVLRKIDVDRSSKTPKYNYKRNLSNLQPGCHYLRLLCNMVSILDIAHLIWLIYNHIVYELSIFYSNLLLTIEKASKTCYQISQVHIKNVRIPQHIALSFTNESNNLDIEAISRLLCWCDQLGIEYVTLYDDLGKLKQFNNELELKHIKRIFKISSSDGRRKFVNDIADLVRERPDSITIDKIQTIAGWHTDPELLLHFGAPLCLHGFPPWPLRLTEILQVRTHRYIPQKIFLDCLKRYSARTQRKGT